MKIKILLSSILLTVVVVIAAVLIYKTGQKNRPSHPSLQANAQTNLNSRQQALHQTFMQTMAQDKRNHTEAELQEAEQLYQVGNKKWGTPEAIQSLQTMIKKYPDLDRTGCAMLYLAQMSKGEDRARYLQNCIDDYNGCFYGDGVQVGAYARFLLAQDCRSQGDSQKADSLSTEIKTDYAGAIDHQGNLLVDSLKTDSK